MVDGLAYPTDPANSESKDNRFSLISSIIQHHDKFGVVSTGEASILAGYEIPLFKGSKGIKGAVFGGWQAQLIALFQSGRQLGAVDAYSTGVSPFISGPKTPDAYYFNACTINTAGARQNCATADQPAVWIQRPNDTLKVAGTRWPQIREMRPALMDSSVFKSF